MDQPTGDLQPAVDEFKPLTGPQPYDRTADRTDELMKKLHKYIQNFSWHAVMSKAKQLLKYCRLTLCYA